MINVDWGDFDEHLIIVKISGQWSLTEYRNAMKEMFALIRSKPHVVDVLVDLQGAAQAPSNIIPVAVNDLRSRPKNQGKVVVISHNPIWSKIWGITQKIHRTQNIKLHFVPSANEAYALVIPEENEV